MTVRSLDCYVQSSAEVSEIERQERRYLFLSPSYSCNGSLISFAASSRVGGRYLKGCGKQQWNWELARQHGLDAVAHPLRLDYVGLKRRLEAVSKVEEKRKKKVASPGFVELIAAHPAASEYLIEFESISME